MLDPAQGMLDPPHHFDNIMTTFARMCWAKSSAQHDGLLRHTLLPIHGMWGHTKYSTGTLDPLGGGGFDEPGSFCTRSSHLECPNASNTLVWAADWVGSPGYGLPVASEPLRAHTGPPPSWAVVVSKPAGQCEGKSGLSITG